MYCDLQAETLYVKSAIDFVASKKYLIYSIKIYWLDCFQEMYINTEFCVLQCWRGRNCSFRRRLLVWELCDSITYSPRRLVFTFGREPQINKQVHFIHHFYKIKCFILLIVWNNTRIDHNIIYHLKLWMFSELIQFANYEREYKS